MPEGKLPQSKKDFLCLFCGACCWDENRALKGCARKNLMWKDGKWLCKIYDERPEMCRVYPTDGECLRMKGQNNAKS
jgi:Fe-S-cluster containining protein